MKNTDEEVKKRGDQTLLTALCDINGYILFIHTSTLSFT